MFETFEPGDIVEYQTEHPWALRRIEIIRHVQSGCYLARALPPFSPLWHESPAEGEEFYMNATAVKVSKGD